MKQVNPSVQLIAHTVIDQKALFDWLNEIGGLAVYDHLTGQDAEQLTELAGRECYRSFDPENKTLNPNISKTRTDSEEYIENILQSGHGSVLEHANVTFIFENVSRVFTHELVRHRAGCAYSQVSLRYVRLDELNFWYPDCIKDNPEAKKVFDMVIKTCEDAQKALALIFDIDKQSFEKKKILTSAFRRIAPMGLATGIMTTFNIRALRWIITQRTSKHAEIEIRMVFNKVYEIVSQLYPMLFQDFSKIYNEDGTFTALPDYNKV